MKTPSKCHQAYNSGLVTRSERPFLGGSSYKICETFSDYKDEPQNLITIGRCKVYRGKDCAHVKHCMPYEMHIWVKRFSELLCNTLAKNVTGAIQDLAKDGVHQSTINRVQSVMAGRVAKFIDNAEEARLSVKSDWAGTARELKDGYGLVYELAVEFLDIIIWIMAEVGINE